MNRSFIAALTLSSVALPFAAFAEAPVADSVAATGGPLQDSWRAAASQLPGVTARAHTQADVQFGPALFRRGAASSAMRVTLDGMPLADPYTGSTTFELPLDALARIATRADGSLSLDTRRAADGASRVLAGVHSEALSPLLGDMQAGGRERYDLALSGRRAVARGFLDLLATGQARSLADREPRFVDRPYPGDAAPELGAAAYRDGRLPGNGLIGASGYARLAWESRAQRWRVSFSGAESHDDWRQYVHTYLFDAPHMPRTKSQWVGGSLALEFHGPVDVELRASRTLSSSDRTDGALDDFGAWGYAARSSPRYDADAPFFWLPGHVYGRYERSRALFMEYAGEAAWRPAPRRTLRLLASAQEWELRRFDASTSQLLFNEFDQLLGADFYGYGYDDHAGESDRSARRPRRQAVTLRDEWRPLERLWADYAVGFVRVEQPMLRTVLTAYGFLHDIEDGKHDDLHFTPEVNVRQEFGGGREWRARARRAVDEAPGRVLAETVGEPPEPVWEMSFALSSALPGTWQARAEVWSRQSDEPDLGDAGRLRAYGSAGRPGIENARGLDVSLSRVAPARLQARFSGAWSRSQHRVLIGRRPDIPWVGSGAPEQDVLTDDDREWQLAAQGALWLGGPPDHRPWRLDAIARAESGAPYTPYQPYNEVTLSAVSGVPSGNLNSRRMPWAFTLDLGATRTFRMAGASCDVSAQLYNALDRHNAAEVFAGTGRPDWTGWLETDDGQAYLQQTGEAGRRLYELAQHDPSNWQRPRTLTVALRASF